MTPWRPAERWLLMGLLLLLGTLACVSLLVGSSQLPARQVLGSLLGQDQPMVDIIVWQVRLPRTLLAIIVGGSLALAGAVLQGLLRNPLAEPGLIGVSGAAALGAVIAFYTGLVNSLPLALPLGGLLGAALAVASLLLLAGRSQSTLTLILAGVAVNSLAGALTALALSLSPNPFAALEIVFWMLGSLANRGMDEVWLAASLAFPGCLCMLMLGRGLTALTLGESVAISLGVDMQRLRWLAVLSAALAVGASVSVTGVIGFVGLVVPHLLRPLVGHAPDRLLPMSLVAGALLLLCTDIATRLLSPIANLQVGVVTALLGAPFFLALLMRLRRSLQ